MNPFLFLLQVNCQIEIGGISCPVQKVRLASVKIKEHKFRTNQHNNLAGHALKKSPISSRKKLERHSKSKTRCDIKIGDSAVMPGKLIYAGTMLNCSALQLQDKFSYARDKFKRNAHNSVDNAVKTAKIIQ